MELETRKFGNDNVMNDYELDLVVFIRVFLKTWKLIVVVAVLIGVAAFLGARIFIAPTYCSSFTAYINNNTKTDGSDTLSNADIQAARSLTGTYAEIISSQTNVENAIALSGAATTYQDLKDSISIGALNNTEIIKTSVITDDPRTSFSIAGALEQTSPEYVSGIVAGSSMKVVTHAELPQKRYGPNYKRIAVIAAMLGAIFMYALFFIRYFIDTRVKSSEELSDRYGVIVIGTIHDLQAAEQSGTGYYG